MLRLILTALFAILLASPPVLRFSRPLDNALYDTMQRRLAGPGLDETGKASRSKDVAVIMIDDSSLHTLMQFPEAFWWPWDRAAYEILVRYLDACGARAFVMDMLLTTPLRNGEAGDAALAQAINDVSIPVVLGTMLGEGAIYDEQARPPAAIPLEGRPDLYPLHLGDQDRPYRPGSLPLDLFLQGGASVGFVNGRTDDDKVIRRARLVARVGRDYVPSLALRTLLDLQPDGVAPPRIDGPGFHLGEVHVPLTSQGDLLLRFLDGGRNPLSGGYFPVYPAAPVVQMALAHFGLAATPEGLDPKAFARQFNGRIVLLGSNSAALHDIKGSPLSDTYPGVLIQATVLENILSGAVRPLPDAIGLLIAPLLALLVVIVILASKGKAWPGLLAGIGLVVIYVGAAAIVFSASLVVLPLGGPLVAGLVSNVLASSVRSLTEGRLRRRLTGLFQHYVPAPVVRRLVENPKLINIAGERREVTVFFSDIKGFTSISNSRQFREHPDELTAFLNQYLTVMTDAILEFGGTIDKYIGDAVVAVFNAPLDQPDHAEAACRAALRCQEVLGQFNSGAEANGRPPLYTRIGISTGPATVGNVGSIHRVNYTVIGQAVNLGARYEAANKVFGTWILTGEETANAVRDRIITREVDLARVPGIEADAEPLRLYEVVATFEALEPDVGVLIDRFGEGLRLYRAREFVRARELLCGIDHDPVAALYARRCTDALETPPPAGTIVHDLKVK